MGIARKQIRWNGWGWAAHQDDLGGCEALWRWLANELGMPALLATPARALEDIALPAPRLTPEQIAGFTALLGEGRVATDDYERAFHARGRSYQDLLQLRAGDLSSAPDAVLYPRGEDDVLALLQLATRQKIAVVPFGGGTSLAGGITAGPGQVTVDLSAMDQVLELDVRAGTALVEGGITGAVLEKNLAAKGLTLGPPPESFEFSTLGGCIASSGGGPDSAAWLRSVRLALPSGILDTQDNSAGPDLVCLSRGSQGAYGIITQARVKLRPATTPLVRVFLFRDFVAGGAAIREAVQAGIAHEMLLLSDAEETRVENFFAELDRPRAGIKARLQSWLGASPSAGTCRLIATFLDRASWRRFAKVAKRHGAGMRSEIPAQRWMAERFQAPYRRDPMLDRGVGIDTIQTTAPWPALPALYAAIRAALEAAMREHGPRPGAKGLVQCHLEHADATGATLCFTFLFARQLDSETVQARAIRQAAAAAVLAHGGAFHPGADDDHAAVTEQQGALGLAALRALKAALDPDGIMNPGKLLPPL